VQEIENMQDETNELDIDFMEKDLTRSERMARSEAARTKRSGVKLVRETKVANEWAKARKAKRMAKKAK
tara:strand:- start:723 stop:929 length:207 start_codon:yes stop_codon:yes gene_type:complete